MRLKTYVRVPYVDPEKAAGDTFLLEQSSREAEPGTCYVRVHPNRQGITFTTTSGSFTNSGSRLYKPVVDYLYMSGQSEVYLRYPQPRGGSVVPEILGRFIDMDGEVVNPELYYNSARRSIVSSERGYAVFRVTYDAPYDLFLAKFSQRGDRVVSRESSTESRFVTGSADGEEDPNATNYLPMMVVGVKGDETHSISPTPFPDPNNETVASGYGNIGTTFPELKIEADPDYPPRLREGAGPDGAPVNASMGIRVYPNVPALLEKSAGLISAGQSYSSVTVVESLSFNGSATAKLSYQPEGSVSVLRVISSSMLDKWGRRFTPRFIMPGREFNSVTWYNANTYGNVIRRTAAADEIVVCSGNESIPAYGVIEVSYTVSYRRHTYTFSYDQEARSFRTAFISARYGEQFATFQANPPSMRGVY